MRRRAFLGAATPLVGGLLAGCVGSGGPTDTSPTATATDTDSPAPSLAATSFSVRSNECGETGDSVRLEAVEGGEVTLAGRIDGPDTCHTARLADASVSADGATLAVDVESYVPESTATKACGPCIVEIRYAATLTVEGGRPDRAVVSHDGEVVDEIALPE